MSAANRIYEMTDNGGSPYRVWYRAKPGLTMGVAECGTKQDAEMVVAALNGQGAVRELARAVEALEQIERELGDPKRLAWEHRHLPAVARAACRRAAESTALALPRTDQPKDEDRGEPMKLIASYRKKPVEVEAAFVDAYTSALGPAPWNAKGGELWKWLTDGGCDFEMRQEDPGPAYLLIHTLEGVMRADIGDYIIRGVKGEHYPCKSDIFEATYEAVADDA